MTKVPSLSEANVGTQPKGPVPATRRLFDNPFLLLFLAIAIPTAIYLIWGITETLGAPIGK